MKKIAPIAAVAALVAAALLTAGLANAYRSGSATVGVQRLKLGRILVDGRRHSLYLFEKDRNGRSTCYGGCAAAWRPLITSGKPQARSGVRASLLGLTRRKDGRWQVTYKRHPLYTVISDMKKGETTGEGVDAFGGEWYLVSPAGAEAEEHDSATSPPAGGYGRYGGY